MRKLAHLALVALACACGDSAKSPPPTDDAAGPLPDGAALEPDAGLPEPDAALPALDTGIPTVGTPDGRPSPSGCEYVAALCAKLAECAPFVLKAAYRDEAGCVVRTGKACTEQSKSRGSGLDQTSVLACAEALGAATCDDVLANKIPACTFHGSYPDGAVCGDHTQCQSGFCSHTGTLCGVCAAKGPAGAACPSGSNDECQTGMVCSPGKLCAPPAEVGGACDDATAPCLMGSFCTTAKTCAKTVAAGLECPGAYLNLRDGTVCLTKGTPAGQIGTATAGQPCGLNPGEGLPATLCAPGGAAACTTTGSGEVLGIPIKGICAAPIEDSRQCMAASLCEAGAQCIGGTCRIPSGRYCEQMDAGAP